MYQTGTFKLAFIKEPQMQVLELPYVNKKLSMIILLPVGTATLEQVKLQDCEHAVEVGVHVRSPHLRVPHDVRTAGH